MMSHFAAPWENRLKLFTIGFSLLGILLLTQAGPAGSLVIIAIFGACSLFAVRGYTIEGTELLVHRLGWAKRLDLTRVSAAEWSPGATLGSIRVWGIGGFLGFVGFFRNAVLGTYHAYVTDPSRAVVLELDGKKIVVSPDRPVEFVSLVKAASGLN